MCNNTIIFFPGLGADSRLSAFHGEIKAKKIWIEWTPPSTGMDIHSYAQVLKKQIPEQDNLIFVGISFGGLIAACLEPMLRPKKVFLIGSLMSSREINPFLQCSGRLLPFIPGSAARIQFIPDFLVTYFFGIRDINHLMLFRKMVNQYSGPFLKHLCLLALQSRVKWKNRESVIRIHGSRDNTINFPEGKTDLVIENGGHLISMTHSSLINEFINRHLERG